MREDSGRLINIYAYLELLYACRIHFGAKRMKRLYTYRNLCEFKNRFIVYFGKYHLCQFARSDTSYAASVRGYAIRRRISMPKCTPFVAHARRTVRRQLNKFFYSLLFTATVDAGRLHLYGIINLIIIEKKSMTKHQITHSQGGKNEKSIQCVTHFILPCTVARSFSSILFFVGSYINKRFEVVALRVSIVCCTETIRMFFSFIFFLQLVLLHLFTQSRT